MISDKPILFLDIDNVMVISSNCNHLHSKYMTESFDQKCVNVLNEIIKETNASIILSSDWKENRSFTVLNEIFRDNGIITYVSDITPDLWGIKFTKLSELEKCRAEEILQYINEHHITNYVAVDDLNLTPWIPDNFVWCPNSKEGIKQNGIKEKIIYKLKSL